jgi:iron complex transport system ATP-binding protein
MGLDTMFEVQNLSFSYGEHEILQGLSFAVRRGELCGLFGPNGCGKTTLFRCCLSFLKFGGKVLLGGHETRSLGVKSLARRIAYVPQEHHPQFPFSVFEVVLMARTPHMASGLFGISRKDQAKALEALDWLDIADLAPLGYTQLSGGQRQLVLIARALAQETNVILLDEPTSSLDFHNQVKVWQVLRRIAGQGITILACSHDPNHVAWFCDRVVMLHDHKIVAEGKPREVFQEDLLNTLYQGSCRVVDAGDVTVVLPKYFSK